MDAAGVVTTINSAAARLLNLEPSVIGQHAVAVFGRADLQALGALLSGSSRVSPEPVDQDIVISREGQEAHLAVVATALVGDTGRPEGRSAGSRRIPSA